VIAVYEDALSADAYAVRLFTSILAIEQIVYVVDAVPVAGKAGPLLRDGGKLFGDVNETLRYLAERYDPFGRWSPSEAGPAEEVSGWLAIANELNATAGEARRTASAAIDADDASDRASAHRILRTLDEHLWFSEDSGSGWLCSAAYPTIADVACFPHVMLAPEGDVSLIEYPALLRWAQRVKKIPGFIVMPGIFPAVLAADVRPKGNP
jgi:glutathione S-transferase